MQQKGRTEQILERLQEMINNGQGSLAPGKVSLPKEELSRLILELSLTMETELKQYRDITDKRAKVLKDAKKQAEDIIYEAEQSASRIRVSGRKTDVAPVRMMDLTETERRSLDNANEIYAATLIYTDEMMAEMQDVIADAYEKISASYEYVMEDLRQKSAIIVANRQELMADLQSMEKEDRYQQIMEIGQLLSEELYYARKRSMGEAAGEPEPAEAAPAEESKMQAGTAKAAGAVGVLEAMKQAAKAAKQAETGNAAEQPSSLDAEKEPDETAGSMDREEALKDDTASVAAVGAQGDDAASVTAVEAQGDDAKSVTAVGAQGESAKSVTAEKAQGDDAASVTVEKAQGDDAASVTAVGAQGDDAKSVTAVGAQGENAKSVTAVEASVIAMDPAMQKDIAATVASALEEKKRGDTAARAHRGRTEHPVEDKKVEVAEITKEVSEAVKKNPQQTISSSVIEAMKRAAKKAVLGLDDEEDDIFGGEPDEDEEDTADESYRTPTQPLDTEEINRRAKQEEAKTPEERHRDFVEAHEEKVRAEEEKWLNAVYNPVIPDANAVDPIVAMVLQEKEAAKKHDV